MFSTVMNNQNPPKWSSVHKTNIITIKQNIVKNEEPTDDHYSRHLENVHVKNKDDEDEEPVIDIENNSKNFDDIEKNKGKQGCEDDEDDSKYDEPKVFQVEDVDLPSLITKPSSKPTSPLLDIMKASIIQKTNFNSKLNNVLCNDTLKSSKNVLSEPIGTNLNNTDINLTSTIATPMHYFSRSSSMTSLNSFDIKSIHSEVASEYSQFTSQVTSQVTSPSCLSKPRKDADYTDYLDDLENLNMPESPSALENSFIMAQRYKHKQQQQIYRQNAAVAMNTLNQQSSVLTANTLNFQQITQNRLNSSNTVVSDNFRILKNDTNHCNMNNNQYQFMNEQANLIKPWNSANFNSQFSTTTLIQKSSQPPNNDLNLIMSRLKLNNNKKLENNIKKARNSESDCSDTASDSSDTLSFLNEKETNNKKVTNSLPDNSSNVTSNTNNTIKPLNLITNSLSISHTPPVKLQAGPKFIQQQKLALSIVYNDNPEKLTNNLIANLNKNNSNSAPCSMSVSYAFMKNSNTQMNPTQNQQTPPNIEPVVTKPSQYVSSIPKFLQNTVYQQQHALQFNQNIFNQNNNTPTRQQNTLKQVSSSSSSSSSQNSLVNNQNNQHNISPTNSDAPYVYMVEKTSNCITPQASKIRRIDLNDKDNDNMNRPPSPQESVCSMMSDSSIPSIIRQDITRSIQKQPQNEFKALFSKLNQNNNNQTIVNEPSGLSQNNQLFYNSNYEGQKMGQNNLLPAFNFLKSNQNFSQNQQQPVHYFSNLNTPTNNNINNPNYSHLDCTYSPKIFQNEGTNSRYDSVETSFINAYENEDLDVNNQGLPNQNSTQIEIKPTETQGLNQEDQDELLLENFIKEMLPPVATSPEPPKTRMASSISSEAPFVQNSLSAKSKFKRNSGSSSSLNSLPLYSKPRINFNRNEKIVTSNKPGQKSNIPFARSTKLITTRTTAVKRSGEINYKTTTALKKTEDFNKITKKPINTSTRSLNKISTTAPVVNMTKTAQLRMNKMAQNSNNSNNISNLNSTLTGQSKGQVNRTRTLTNTNSTQKSTFQKISTPGVYNVYKPTQMGNSVQLNPHLDHLNRNNTRRKSFSVSGINSKSSNLNIPKKSQNQDTSISSLSNNSQSSNTSISGTTSSVKTGTTIKPKSTWK